MDQKDVNRIEFPAGLTLSPIISKVEEGFNPTVSTIVQFELKDDVNPYFIIGENWDPYKYTSPLAHALSVVTVGLDVDVYYEEDEKTIRIHQNIESPSFDNKEWLEGLIIENPDNIDELASNLERLVDERGTLIGLLLPPEWYYKMVFSCKNKHHQKAPCITTIGGLACISNLGINFDYDSPAYIGFLNGVEGDASRNGARLEEPTRRCLQSWAQMKYRKNYLEIIDSSELSRGYSHLIGVCRLEDRIIQDNTRLLYSTYRGKIEVGTIYGLLQLFRYLLSGINDINFTYLSSVIFIDELEMIMDPEFPITIKKRMVEDYNADGKQFIKELIQVDDLQWYSASDIITKYYKIYNVLGLLINEQIPCFVWVNLMLDVRCHQMIDWGKVDLDVLDDLLLKKSFDGIRDYLNQFMTNTEDYFAEIGIPLTENT